MGGHTQGAWKTLQMLTSIGIDGMTMMDKKNKTLVYEFIQIRSDTSTKGHHLNIYKNTSEHQEIFVYVVVHSTHPSGVEDRLKRRQ